MNYNFWLDIIIESEVVNWLMNYNFLLTYKIPFFLVSFSIPFSAFSILSDRHSHAEQRDRSPVLRYHVLAFPWFSENHRARVFEDAYISLKRDISILPPISSWAWIIFSKAVLCKLETYSPGSNPYVWDQMSPQQQWAVATEGICSISKRQLCLSDTQCLAETKEHSVPVEAAGS